jgi:hypothetical protein
MKLYIQLILSCLSVLYARSQNKATITIDASKPTTPVSKNLHGVFFEEISHGGEGGLYAELIQNRGFEESTLPHGATLQNGFIVPDPSPHFNLPNNQVSDWKMEWPYKSKWPGWRLMKSDSSLSLALATGNPVNEATPHYLQVQVKQPGKNALVNEGFWGINVEKDATYELSFFVRVDARCKGAITASLQSANGASLAAYTFPACTNQSWRKYV